MKANLFALFCITLFVLSVPQTFAQTTTEAEVTDPTTTETPVDEVTTTSVEEAPPVEAVEVPAEPQEPAAPAEEKSDDDEEVANKSEVTTIPETEEKESDSDEVNTESAAAIETPVTETQPEQEVVPVTPVSSPEDQQGSTEEVQAGSGDAPQAGDNTVVAEPGEQTETTAPPTESTESTDATNTEPATPVGVPEESQQETATTEESPETAPVAEGEGVKEAEEEKDSFSIFGLIGKVLMGLGVLTLVILVGCVYNYRYQMKKYKIAPFTPPSFLPECLFPRTTESTGRLVSGYTELQVGNYQAAPRFAEI